MDFVPWTKNSSINYFHFWLKLVYRHHVNQKCIKPLLPVFVLLNLVQPNSEDHLLVVNKMLLMLNEGIYDGMAVSVRNLHVTYNTSGVPICRYK